MSRKFNDHNLLIDDILKNFDFDKCHLVMKNLNWRWGFENKVPTVEDLKISAKDRLQNVIDGIKESKPKVDVPYFSYSGGLKAEGWRNHYGHIVGLKLEFILTDWESDGDS